MKLLATVLKQFFPGSPSVKCTTDNAIVPTPVAGTDSHSFSLSIDSLPPSLEVSPSLMLSSSSASEKMSDKILHDLYLKGNAMIGPTSSADKKLQEMMDNYWVAREEAIRKGMASMSGSLGAITREVPVADRTTKSAGRGMLPDFCFEHKHEGDYNRMTIMGMLFVRLFFNTRQKLMSVTRREGALFGIPGVDFIQAIAVKDTVHIFTMLDDVPTIMEDDINLFPSDGLIAKLHTIVDTIGNKHAEDYANRPQMQAAQTQVNLHATQSNRAYQTLRANIIT